MPLEKPSDFGTNAMGYRENDYCHFCYANGAFTQPGLTVDEMIERTTAIMVSQERMAERPARALLTDTLPRLKRWRQPARVDIEGRGFTGGDEIC
jgi:hypothetical protein